MKKILIVIIIVIIALMFFIINKEPNVIVDNQSGEQTEIVENPIEMEKIDLEPLTPYIFEDGYIHGITIIDTKLYDIDDTTKELATIKAKTNVSVFIEDNEDYYKVEYDNKIGFVSKNDAKYFTFNSSDKYVLGIDVSGFNYKREFYTKEDFELYLLNNNMNYAIIRLGGRGYGKAGNMYLDEKVDVFVEACEYLGVPYGFYFLDEALTEQEIEDEYNYIKDGLAKYSNNKFGCLPLTIDMENQHGDGRADDIWPERVELLNSLIDKFKQDDIEIMIYANGARIETYLKDVNCVYWTAAYTLDGNIPKVFYDDFIKNEEKKNKNNPSNIENSILNHRINLSDTDTIWYSDEYLNKVVGWQFTESAAPNDGISGNIDLNLFKTEYIYERISSIINKIDEEEKSGSGTLKSTEDINLQDVDGKGKNYKFTYNGEEFTAKFSVDTWKIIDSYKITNQIDIAIICQALINEHSIPSKDRTSYRTIKDLVYEWVQHNVAYRILPDDNSWKKNAKDVDLDPDDQGRSLQEMYEARTNK